MKRLLAQLNPGATTLTTLYTAPAARTIDITALCVCNQAGTAGSFRVSIGARGAAENIKQYLFYDEAIAANTTRLLSLPGLVMQSNDVMRVYGSSASLSFNLFGDEI